MTLIQDKSKLTVPSCEIRSQGQPLIENPEVQDEFKIPSHTNDGWSTENSQPVQEPSKLVVENESSKPLQVEEQLLRQSTRSLDYYLNMISKETYYISAEIGLLPTYNTVPVVPPVTLALVD
ncbi:hypothetical protein FQR65_LT03705 [Abscondita terminalis]|nr:hypothetical protein FQR65_LT03705 [Abscondita terminalis]